MSHLTYHHTNSYSQAVTLPSTGTYVQISGQGGWDRDTTPAHSRIPADLRREIEQAYENVDRTIRAAGGVAAEEGMRAVYKLVMYLAPMNDEASEILVSESRVREGVAVEGFVGIGKGGKELMKGASQQMEVLKKWFPDHKPLVTGVGVEKLALPGMRVEIEAYAHLP